MKLILLLVLSFSFDFTWAKLETLGKIDNFKFINQNGKYFGTDELKGKPWVAIFIFTKCQGVCPILIKDFIQWSKNFDELEKVVLTVDPENDTPQKLKEYADRHGVSLNGWNFLTEKKDLLDKVYSEQFLIGNTKGQHIEKMILVDKKGIIRGYYKIKDQSKELNNDVKLMLQEK